MKNILNGTIQLNQTHKHVFNLYFDRPLVNKKRLFSKSLIRKRQRHGFRRIENQEVYFCK